MQSLRVQTARGAVVLASDASHFYEHHESGRPFTIVYNLADMLEGHRRLHQLAASPAFIVQGTTRRCWSATRALPATRSASPACTCRLRVKDTA